MLARLMLLEGLRLVRLFVEADFALVGGSSAVSVLALTLLRFESVAEFGADE